MKILLFLTAMLFLFSFSRSFPNPYPVVTNRADTGHIIHVLDGLITEWPADKFQSNGDSTMEFASDNDNKNLYIAISIPDFDMQMKIMRNGMKLFIDPKGKKKEGKGVDFPIKGEVNNFASGITNPAANSNGDTDPQKKKLDRKSARNILSLGLNAIKLFGFGDNGQDEQGLLMPGSVNVAFKWDASDVMHIEYAIPLSMIGELSSMNQKDISLGWKINAFERPERPSGTDEPGESAAGADRGQYSRGSGMGGGRGMRGGGGRGYGGGSARGTRRLDPDEMKKEQSFWIKYIVAIQTDQKAF